MLRLLHPDPARDGPAAPDAAAPPRGVDRLVAPVLVLLLVAIVAIAGVLAAAARSQDAAAGRQAQRSVAASLAQAKDRLLATAADYANWDDAVTALALHEATAVPDAAWVAANLGATLADTFGVTGVLLLDDAGRMRLAIADSASVTLPEGLGLPAALTDLARQAAAVPAGRRGLAAAIVGVDGVAHIAAAADLRWEADLSRPAAGAVLVLLRKVGPDLLAEVAAPLAVGAIRFVPQAGEAGNSLALAGPDGAPLGALAWEAPAPATEFLADVLWIVLAIIAAMILLTALFLSGAQRAARERAALGAKLRDREVRLRRLVENLPELVALVKEGRIDLLNDGGAVILGARQPGTLLGRRLDDLVAPADRDRATALLAEATLSGDDGAWHDLRLLSLDGTPVPVRLRLAPLTELGPGSVLAVARDLRAETRAREDLRAALAKAEVADRAKAHFLSNVSHELRTPLNAIIGFSQILKDELLGGLGNPHYKDYATDIHDGGMYLLQLVNDLLDLARLDSGDFELNEGWVDLSTLAARCTRMVQAKAAAAGVPLETEMRLEGYRLLADELRLKQALVNLLQNAIRASPRGEGVRLSGSLDTQGDVVLRVTDRGPGMTPSEIAIALSAFGKVTDASHRQTGGIGLGLPLAKGYAEAHGGTLGIASTPGVGTTVSLTLPGSRLYHPDLMRA